MTEAYKAFLETQEWAHIRQDSFRLNGSACKACGSFTGIHQHHVFYPRYVRDTRAHHLIPLCFKCHSAAHNAPVPAYTKNIGEMHAVKSRLLGYLVSLNKRETFFDYPRDRARLKAQQDIRHEHEQAVAERRRHEKWAKLASRKRGSKNKNSDRNRLLKIADKILSRDNPNFVHLTNEEIGHFIVRNLFYIPTSFDPSLDEP